jgi:hypothetical protein
MTVAQVLATVRYVTDSKGETTDVLIPLTAWKALLASWKQLMESLEDQEDSAILQEWLAKRAAGKVEAIPLDTLEQELISTPPGRPTRP